MITESKEIVQIYNTLPENKKKKVLKIEIKQNIVNNQRF